MEINRVNLSIREDQMCHMSVPHLLLMPHACISKKFNTSSEKNDIKITFDCSTADKETRVVISHATQERKERNKFLIMFAQFFTSMPCA